MRLPVFYGWVVVAVAFITIAIGVNARTAFSLLYPPILEEFGWSRGVTAATFSVGFWPQPSCPPLLAWPWTGLARVWFSPLAGWWLPLVSWQQR